MRRIFLTALIALASLCTPAFVSGQSQQQIDDARARLFIAGGKGEITSLTIGRVSSSSAFTSSLGSNQGLRVEALPPELTTMEALKV